ncbi:hypothetical protein [Pendulispora albinea]|uniref:Pyrrolo-quinoline quinone n=1 Tax=Pendulispora albinea TaxID=2741071 RepID=A0ABZ2M0U5_9BACT
MKRTLLLSYLLDIALLSSAAACSSSEPDPGPQVSTATPRRGAQGEVLTSKNDNARTGANLDEDVLDPQSARNLVLVARLPVDGELYAQPLLAGDVETDAGKKNLVLLATTNSSVYAFDLDAPNGARPVWHTGKARELGTPGITTRNVDGPNGILSTPVVDKKRGLIYVVARSCDGPDAIPVAECPSAITSGRCKATIFALDLRTGAIRASRAIAASLQDESNAPLVFDATVHWNRPALLLEGDGLYVAFGSGPNGDQHEEDFVYHGWLFRYDVADLAREPAVYITTPHGGGGSVWQSGSGPASDGAGVFFTAANPILDCSTHPPASFPASPKDAEDSVLRLPLDYRSSPNASARAYADTRPYAAAGYAGTVFQFTASADVGFGSGGPTLIPDSRDVVVGTKGGIVYLLDRDTLRPTQEPIVPFTALPLQGDHELYVHSWHDIPTLSGAFAIFRHESAPNTLAGQSTLFAWAADDYLRSFHYDHAARTLVLARTANVPAMPRGAFVSLSARGHARGSAIVWATSRSLADRNRGHIWAFDAESLERLWDSETTAFSKFTPPTIARGKLIVPSAITSGAREALVYGVPR